MWGKSVRGKESNQCKSPKTGAPLMCWRNIEKVSRSKTE